ncbi:hypothetical protein ACT3CD_13210 [Geofilum sp. OHC36d9]|uniref:hypothetical protein n=1 Tax=Geofilum sp. OHC36d9 TaxID=3458413 RepID=UPI004034ED5F
MNTLSYHNEKMSSDRFFTDDGKIRLKKGYVILVFTLMSFLFNVTPIYAQDSAVSHFNLDLRLKNMHLWQGFVVTPGAMMATSMEYTTNDQKFVAGIWGGAGFDGTYKEFSYYTTYRFTNNFQAQLISHNNYSQIENPKIFSYDKYTSPNFLDIVLSYTASERMPLSILWSTILFGQGGDYVNETDGTVTDSYSNYVELNYLFMADKQIQIKAFVGGAFSFVTEKTFYSTSPAIVNMGVTLSQDVKFLNKKIPVSGTAFWNPESGKGALQIDIMLF